MIPYHLDYDGVYEDPVFFSYPRQTIDGDYLIATKLSELHLPQMKAIVAESKARAQFTSSLGEDEIALLVNDISKFLNRKKENISKEDKAMLDKYPQRHIPVEERKVALSVLNELGDCVGFIYLENIHWVNRTSEVHLALVKDLDEKLVKDALGLVIYYAKNVLNLRKISVETATDEVTYLSAGFTKVGTRTEHYVLPDGSKSDAHMFERMLRKK